MGVASDGQVNTRQVRGTQDGAARAEPDPNSKTAANSEGSGIGGERVGIGRESCTQGVFGGELLGGILTQLIEQAEDQLRETQECISWYQRAEEKARKQLENLKQLQQLADQETEAE